MFGPQMPDIILQDRDDQPIGVVEVESRIESWPDAQKQLQDYLNRLVHLYPTIAFGILVDAGDIWVFHRDAGEGTLVAVAHLDTKEILRHYAPEFAGKDHRYVDFRFYRDLMETLVTSWLRDLANRWKSEHPPGLEELVPTGLIERLEGGFAGGKPREELAESWGLLGS
jgi:hypothetical protein